MEDERQKQEAGIPENAFRELKPGEEYIPVMRPDRQYPEVTPYSVIMGLVMAIIFSAAAAYLGLKVGQVFEAAIPIAIIAVGVSGALKKKNALGQNVIIQSIGASSGIVVAGAIFTLPALYILQAKYGDAITVSFIEIFLSSMLGGVLGVLMFIPFRKYFVSDMHGKFPFPEATATTQVLISGEKSGSQVKPLIIAGAVGGIYDFLLSTFGWWAETLTSKATEFGAHVASQAKMVFKINTGAAVLGLGYIVGLKYCFIIFAGSAFIWYVIVPLLGMSPEAAAIDPEVLFKTQARYIGIGGIAMSGIIGIIKSWGIIRSAVGLAGCGKSEAHTERHFDESACLQPYRSVGSDIRILLLRRNPQPLPDPCGIPGGYGDSVSLHHGGRQCNCHCGIEPGERNDADDADCSLSGVCGYRT